MRYFLLCTFLFLPLGEGQETLQSILDRYRRSKTLTSRLVKVMELSLLETKETSYGRLYFSKDKLRIEFTHPEKSLLVINGPNIWIERRFPKEFGDQIQVIKIPISQKKNLQNPLAAFLKYEDSLDTFQVVHTQQGPQSVYQLTPKNKKDYPNVVKIKVIVRDNNIKKFSYWDELENKTTYIFNQFQFNLRIPKSRFLYSPPKDVKVTEI